MKRRAYLYFVATFVIGVILGAIGMYTCAWNTGHWRRKWNEEAVIRNMQKRLNLSPPQVQELRSVLDEGGKELRNLSVQLHPQYVALHQQIRGRIRQILNPDQVKKFNEILREKLKGRKSPPK